MSLRDLGVFEPLKPDHPLVRDSDHCWKCGVGFCAGMRTALLPYQSAEETGSLTVEARPVCATCFMRGTEISTPKGRRIVESIKQGDGSPFPVVTTDGKQWRADEVSP
jgi:hypothetical protein